MLGISAESARVGLRLLHFGRRHVRWGNAFCWRQIPDEDQRVIPAEDPQPGLVSTTLPDFSAESRFFQIVFGQPRDRHAHETTLDMSWLCYQLYVRPYLKLAPRLAQPIAHRDLAGLLGSSLKDNA